MIESFPASPLFLNLMTPFVLRRGVFGRIENIDVISQVCKSWQNWIYSEEGPFSSIEAKIRQDIRTQPPKCGELNYLNSCLKKTGNVAFKIIAGFAKGKPLPIVSNKDPFNYVNDKLATPLQKALDIVLLDITKLDLVEYLIKQEADLKHSVNDPKWGGKFVLCNYFVYIFRHETLINDVSTKTDITNRLQVASLLLKHGLSIHHLGADGNSLLHHYNFFDDQDGSILSWYLDHGGNLDILNLKGLTPVQYLLTSSYYLESEAEQIVEAKQVVDAKRLVKVGASCKSPNVRGDYWLHQLIHFIYFNPQAVKQIVNTILDVNPEQFFTKDAQGKIPLQLAIRFQTEHIQEVLFSYAEKNHLKKDPSFQISLFKAAIDFVQFKYHSGWFRYYDNDALSMMLDGTCGKIPISTYTEDDLKKQIMLPFNDLLKKMTLPHQKYTCLLNIPDESGNTLCHHLALICPKLIELYLRAYPELSSKFDKTNHQGEDVYDLKVKGENTQSLLFALVKKDFGKVKTLLSQSIYIDITDGSGHSLLHLARSALNRTKAEHENIHNVYVLMKKLLKRGINPNQRDVNGKTPLDYYRYPGFQRLYVLLRNHGAKFSTELANT